MRMFLEDIGKVQKEVNEYSPNDKLYLVASHLQEWLWRAVSPRFRDEWKTKYQSSLTPTAEKKFDAAFAASAVNKLPVYKANLNQYTVRNPAEERLMKGVLKNIADYKIF